MNASFKRQLVAIVYADVVGYSRLTSQDEEGTHQALRETLEILTEQVDRHGGEVVHFAGDAVLAKFNTVTDAVTCAVEAQRRLSVRNEPLPQHKRVEVRLGVNLGEVILDREDIYGDGVNVAVRIQELAGPGGICVSESVRDAVGRKLPIVCEFMGEQRVKNIDRPIRTYRVQAGSLENDNKPIRAAAKPSIAVLPFEYLGKDDDGGLSDGLTEDVIRAMCGFRGLNVIGHHSPYFPRDKTLKIQDIGRELEVEYVLEGTLRRTESRVRITAQLIEADSGRHLWADSYDKTCGDPLDLQADVATSISATLSGRLRVATQKRALDKTADRLDVYDYVLLGQALSGDGADENRKARELFEHAIAVDPACSRAYSGLAITYLSDFLDVWIDDYRTALGSATVSAVKSIELDDMDAKGYWLLGELKMYSGDMASAYIHIDKASALNQNDTDVYAARGVVLTYDSKPKEAVRNLERAVSLNPYHPVWYLWALGLAHYAAGNYEAAILPLLKAVEWKPECFMPLQHLVAVYMRLAKETRAREIAARVITANPKLSESMIDGHHPFHDAADRQHYLEALRRGGLEL